MMHYVATGKRLYNNTPWTYTRCQDRQAKGKIIIGGFTTEGLHIYYGDFINASCDIGGVWKF